MFKSYTSNKNQLNEPKIKDPNFHHFLHRRKPHKINPMCAPKARKSICVDKLILFSVTEKVTLSGDKKINRECENDGDDEVTRIGLSRVRSEEEESLSLNCFRKGAQQLYSCYCLRLYIYA